MARKLPYTINRFDGGITNDLRSGDYSKCAFVSHFDIYRDPNRLYPLPGYVADMNDGATATGMRQYNTKAITFSSVNGQMYSVGTKSDGSGWKLWTKAITGASWSPTISGGPVEGTYTLLNQTFLHYDDTNALLQFMASSGGTAFISEHELGVGSTENALSLGSYASSTETRAVAELAPTDVTFSTQPGAKNLEQLGATLTANAKTTGGFPYDIHAHNELVGIAVANPTYPRSSALLLWDAASVLIEQKIKIGTGRAIAVGNVDGFWVVTTEEGMTASTSNIGNGLPSAYVSYVSGTEPVLIARLTAVTQTNAVVKPIRAEFRNTFLFEAVIPQDATPTTYKRGVWAVGRTTPNSPPALSLLFNSDTLGTLQNVHTFGNQVYFIHGGDGSISKLDNLLSGTFNETAVYETLFFGSETPNQKSFDGFTVHTEDLPASATVTVKYRFDENSAWTTLGTSSTDGDRYHHFTRASGVPIGNFTEIQFRVEVLGNAPIKSINCMLTDLDTRPYG
jgi:hypothetical protein